MKNTKKKVLLVAIAVCLIAILSMGTLAWFNANDVVTNTFKFDDTDGDGTPDFKIDVFETDKNGNEVQGKEYTDIMPNAVLAKDPTVRNDGDYDMYARVIVTLSDANAWMKAAVKYNILTDATKDTVLETMVDLNAKWVRFDNVKYDATADTLTYVYYYNEVVGKDGGVSEKLFTKVTIPSALQTEDMAFGDDAFTIAISGDAIQSDNITVDDDDTNGNKAYDAFSFVNWTAGTPYEN